MSNRSAVIGAVLLGSVSMLGNVTQAATIEGTVRGSDGKPAAAADVRAEVSRTKQVVGTSKTDKNGRYKFNRLVEGTPYRITASVNKVSTAMDNVKTREEAAIRVDLDIKAAASGKKSAKHWVYMKQETGTHLGGRWIEVDENGQSGAAAGNMDTMSGRSLQGQKH
jgi:carboxypeptidase family protein